MISGPTVLVQNTQIFFENILGAEAIEAKILTELFILSTEYRANLSILLPVFKGIILLKNNNTNGKVIVNTGMDKGHHYYSVEVRQVMESIVDNQRI